MKLLDLAQVSHDLIGRAYAKVRSYLGAQSALQAPCCGTAFGQPFSTTTRQKTRTPLAYVAKYEDGERCIDVIGLAERFLAILCDALQ